MRAASLPPIRSIRFFCATPVAMAAARLACLATLGWGAWGTALAQGNEAAAVVVTPRLKSSAQLSEKTDAAAAGNEATFLFGDRLTGRPDLETVIEGNAEVRRGATSMRADRIEYYQPNDLLKSRGNVRINRAGNRFEGPELELELDRFEGFFTSPSYRFLATGGNGAASRADFIDDKHFTLQNATYTTCQRNDEASWKPAWVLTADAFEFDLDNDVGVASGAVLRFKEVPILAFPAFSFPLSDKRKSGFLPPTFSLGSVNGFELRQPYYFDIAPNRDATISPAIMAKRGVDLAGEYRYLAPTYKGSLRGNYLPGDKLRDRDRWSYALRHSGSLDTQIPSIGALGLNLNLNRVSDDNYWKDFPTNYGNATANLSPRLFSQEATLSWSQGYFSSSLRALKWQTLQDVASPIIPPYNRLPQLTAAYGRVDAPIGALGKFGQAGTGFDYSVEADYTRFSADRTLTLQPNADRAFTKLQLSQPLRWPAGFITPKVLLNATSYQFDAPLANGSLAASRVVPTFSLDSGLQFERQARFFGRSLTQTLEPRAFYVNTPFRNQSGLPNYDSGANDFNFASIYTENAFVGNDRISDANLLTLGVTSRLIDPDTGAEAARFGIAQRLRFSDQQVTLPGVLPVNDRISDLLLGSTLNWVPQWSLDGTVQYNPKTKQSDRTSLSLRYNPSNYRIISAAYRRQRGISQDIDVGFQWPINDLWGDKGQNLGPGRGQGGGRYYGVGRLNYSLQEKKLVDAVLGVEYDGCCWIGRVVLQRTQNGITNANTRILFQLELVGFSRLGSSPLETLKTNVPRYQYLREKISAPSRFTTYD